MTNDYEELLRELNISNEEVIEWMKIADVDNLIEIESSNYHKILLEKKT